MEGFHPLRSCEHSESRKGLRHRERWWDVSFKSIWHSWVPSRTLRASNKSILPTGFVRTLQAMCKCWTRHWRSNRKQNQTSCSYGTCSLAGKTETNQVIIQINMKLQWGRVLQRRCIYSQESTFLSVWWARMVRTAPLLSWVSCEGKVWTSQY